MFLYEKPINSFAITAEYCVRGFHSRLKFTEKPVVTRDRKERTLYLIDEEQGFTERLKLSFRLLNLKVRMWFLNWSAYLVLLFMKWFRSAPNELNGQNIQLDAPLN